VLLIGIRMISCRRVMQCIHRYAVLNPNEVRLSELIYSAVMLVTEIAGWMMMISDVIRYYQIRKYA
jgi:hypothetical protein